MRVFEILLNGKKLCTAGVGEDGVLTAIVNWVRLKPNQTERASSRRNGQELRLHIGGLGNSEHISWQDRLLQVGDEVCIRIGESDKSTKPSHRKKSDPAKEERAKKKYVMNAAKAFGWTIIKNK